MGWLYVGLAEGVAEMALVDAVELVVGREVHGLHDAFCALTSFKPSLRFFHAYLFNGLADRHFGDLRKSQVRQLT